MIRDNIALVGKFGSGKTTLAEALINNDGYTRVSFAARLKKIAAEVYNDGLPIDKSAIYATGLTNKTLSGREILQQLGQSVKTLDERFWIKYLNYDLRRGTYGDGPFVTDDCRFPYEADALRDEGFLIVRIETPEPIRMDRYEKIYGRRPTLSELNHPSETEVDLIKPDLIVDGQASPDYNLSRIFLRMEGLREVA